MRKTKTSYLCPKTTTCKDAKWCRHAVSHWKMKDCPDRFSACPVCAEWFAVTVKNERQLDG